MTDKSKAARPSEEERNNKVTPESSNGGGVVDRQTRVSLMTEALRALATARGDGDFVVFADLQTQDYVQFMRMPFLGEGNKLGPLHARLALTGDLTIPKAQCEVTDRGLHRVRLPSSRPTLSASQVVAIEADGFRLVEHPNFTASIDLVHFETIAEECEHRFGILGSMATFDLVVTSDA